MECYVLQSTTMHYALYTFFYKNIVYKNIEAQILDIKQWIYCLEQ